MARQRRPSIPLIILFIILLILFLFAGTFVEIASSLSTQGSFTLTYDATDNEPIVSITYTLPQDLADAIVPEQAAGWTVNLADNTLRLMGGTLNSGESVTVDYHLSKYISAGTRTITVTSTKANGEKIEKQTSLPVREALLLSLAWMLYQNSIWLLVLAIIVLVIIIVLFILGKKKDEEQEKKEEETGPTSPQEPS